MTQENAFAPVSFIGASPISSIKMRSARKIWTITMPTELSRASSRTSSGTYVRPAPHSYREALKLFRPLDVLMLKRTTLRAQPTQSSHGEEEDDHFPYAPPTREDKCGSID